MNFPSAQLNQAASSSLKLGQASQTDPTLEVHDYDANPKFSCGQKPAFSANQI